MSPLIRFIHVISFFLLLSTFFTVAAIADDVLEKIIAMEYIEPRTKFVEGFTNYGGEWTVDNDGVLSVGAGSGPKLVFDDPKFENMSEGEVSVDIFCSGNHNDTNAGILTKVRDAATGADNFIGYEIAIRPEHGEINLGRHRFNYEAINRTPCRIATERWINLKVAFSERTMEVFIDENSVFKYEDKEAPLLSGAIALRPWQRPAKYRNLRIKTANDADWTSIPFVPIKHEPVKSYPETLAVDKLPPLLVLTRHPLHRPPAVGQDLMQGQFEPGCSIRLIHPAEPKTPSRTIFSDPGGNIYDMNLSIDAKTIYFSHKKHGDRNYRLWKIGVDGNGLEQLTDGQHCDVSPCEVPGGDLVFVSTRRFGYTVCQPGPASNLYRLIQSGEDKGKAFCISMDTLSDMGPQLLPDGRVIFMRWEYIDRDLTYRQSLWTQLPNGTAYRLFFGNTIRDMGTIWQAREIPGESNRVLATFAPHHNHPHGAIGIVDRNYGVEGSKGSGFKYVSQEVKKIGDTDYPWGYRDPFPLTADTYLCSYGDQVGLYDDGKKRFKIYLLDSQGRKRLLYEDKEHSCYFPIPLRSFEVPPTVSYEGRYLTDEALTNPELDVDEMGTLLLVDIEEGLQGKLAPGTIKSLRIMEQVRKTEDIVHRAFDQSPVMSYGTYYAKRDWGTIPLESDGSAHFYVPALREIYIQALDADGREVQRMTSALQVMPGEQLACTGCHESRDSAPPEALMPIAAGKQPKMPVSPDWLIKRKRLNPEPDARIFDYPSVVQPVLDKHCTTCHEGGNPAGGYDLSGDKTRFFSMSYENLLGRSKSYRQHDMEFGFMLPEEAAKGKPLVHFFWLLFTPSSVSVPYESGTHASRLTEIIESEHNGLEMPLEDRQILYYWMDANVPYYGTYAHARPGSSGRRDRFADPANGRQRAWYEREFKEVYRESCQECHGRFEQNDNRDWIGRYAWINLSRPENSAALTAHLSEDDGGRGIKMTEERPFLKKDGNEYQTMLRAIEKGKAEMLRLPEADMPDFKNSRPEP